MIANIEKYIWTNHARQKMRYYRLSESRVKRIIRHPARIEEGILENAIACMQPLSPSVTMDKSAREKKYSEIWVMYVLVNAKFGAKNIKQIKIITAWRYPGKSPERDPIPLEVLREVKNILWIS